MRGLLGVRSASTLAPTLPWKGRVACLSRSEAVAKAGGVG